MKSITTFITLILCAILLFGCSNKQNIDRTFSRDAYWEDLEQLVDSIQENHPQPYEFITEKSFNDLVDEKKATISSSTTLGEFIWICKSIMAAIGCSHSNVSIGSRLGEIDLPGSILFPMDVKYIDSALYVIDPLSNKALIQPGAEIVSINDIGVQELKKEMKKAISSDGYIQSYQDEEINFNFRIFCAFQLRFPKKYKVKINDKETIKKIELIETDDRPPIGHDYNSLTRENRLHFEIDSDNSLAIITIKNFVFYDNDLPKFQSFIDDCFNQIKHKNIKDLVIDIRDNPGGYPFSTSYLLQHITNKPFRYFKEGTQDFYPDMERMIPPHENKFMKKPFILINGNSSSAAGHISSLIKAHNLGIFVGQETGSTFSCNGKVMLFSLNNTGIYASLGTQNFQTDVQGFSRERGIVPDYEIKPEISDLLNGKDLEMEKVINLINN